MRKSDLQKAEEFLLKVFSEVEPGHDLAHARRVCSNAKAIFKKYKRVDKKVVELSALLHDVIDEKLFDDLNKQKKTLLCFLDSLNLTAEQKEHIILIIDNLSFGKSLDNRRNIDSLEYKIVQDADLLDAIGAIGIARAFSFGGAKKRKFYDPKIKPQKFNNQKQYRKSQASANSATINHFYEKLLLLKDRMYTSAAKQIAKKRHKFMEKFLEEFIAEWEGKK